MPSVCPAGRALARMAIEEMVVGEAEEVVLEAEVTNTGALALYRSLGFIRDKHLHRWAWHMHAAVAVSEQLLGAAAQIVLSASMQ